MCLLDAFPRLISHLNITNQNEMFCNILSLISSGDVSKCFPIMYVIFTTPTRNLTELKIYLLRDNYKVNKVIKYNRIHANVDV